MRRACTLTADLAGTGERAVKALLGRGLADQSQVCLQEYLHVCSEFGIEVQPSEWDDEEADYAPFPSLAAVDAALDVLEVITALSCCCMQ
jgi:hypothetical protein